MKGGIGVNNIKLGRIGEETAAEILRNKGYMILQRNYRCSMGEVDIIAAKDAKISFIEVKTRQGTNYGRPCEAVGTAKQKRIKSAAICYLKDMERRGYIPGKISFDVMEITVEHIESAF